MKDNCNKNCSNCNGTELPNISDTKEINIGYSYAYKTDCAGDRYIKAEEVKYLIECERNKAIDDLIAKCENAKFAESDEISLSDVHTGVNSGLSMAIHFAEQLKAGVNK